MKAARMRHNTTEEESFWPSFTDVMSSMVFILFFFIILMFIRQLVSSHAFDTQLTSVNKELAQKQQSLENVNKSLEAASSELNKKKDDIASLGSTLSQREQEIAALQAQLELDRDALKARESELSAVRWQLQEISVLRLSILKQVKDSIEGQLGSSLQAGKESLVSIDDNANLVINSQLLFAKGSSDISESGYRLLEKFSYAFEKVLADNDIRNSIDSIVISGYADSDDDFDNNYALSCERAIQVIIALMQKNPTLEKNYGSYFQASGFSEFRPVSKGTDEASKSKNRRIQIAINVKDSTLQKIINDYMKTPQ